MSVFGESNEIWVEGEGMLHALYFTKNCSASWSVSYANRYVQSETLKIEKARQKPCFLPAIEGDSAAIIAAYILNYVTNTLQTHIYICSVSEILTWSECTCNAAEVWQGEQEH